MARTKRSAATAADLLISTAAATGSAVSDRGKNDENFDNGDGDIDDDGDKNDGQEAAPPPPKRSRRPTAAASSSKGKANNAKSRSTSKRAQAFEPEAVDGCVPLPREWLDAARPLDPGELVDLSLAPTFPHHAHNLSVEAVDGNNVDDDEDVIPTRCDDHAFLFDELVELPYYVPLPSGLDPFLDAETSTYTGDSRAVLADLSKCLIQPVLLVDRPVINAHTCMYDYGTPDINVDSLPLYEAAEYVLPPTDDEASLDSLSFTSFHGVQSESEHFKMTHRLRQRHRSERMSRRSGCVVAIPERNRRIVLRTVWLVPQAWDGDQFKEMHVTVPTAGSPLRDSICPAMLKYLSVALHPVPGCTYADPRTVPTSAKMYTYRWSVWLRMDELYKDLVADGDGAAKATIRELLAGLADACGWTSSVPASLESFTCPIPSVIDAAADAAQLDPFVFDNDVQLDPSQLACASWLIHQEQANPRSISVIPSNTRIHAKLVRLGPDGFLFFPLTHRIHRPDPSPHAPTHPIPPITIQYTDMLIKPPAGAASSVILPILAHVHTNQLQRPHPLPAHQLPSRATLVVCHPLALVEWQLAARRIFPNPDQVIVIDSKSDFHHTTLHQVLAADLVLVSDTFLITAYDHHLHHLSNLIGQTSHESYRQFLWCPSFAGRSYLQPRTHPPANDPVVTTTGGPAKRGRAPAGPANWLRAPEATARALAHLAHVPVGVTSTEHEHDYEALLSESRISFEPGDSDSDSEVTQRAREHVLRRGKFHVPIEERVAEQRVRVRAGEVCPLLHLVHWHRVVFDGPTRASERGEVLDRVGGVDKALFRHATPLRELCGSSTVTVLHSAAAEGKEAEVDSRTAYQMLNINANDAPPADLPVRAQHELLAQLAAYMPTAPPAPAACAPPPVQTVPVYPTGEEHFRAAILTAMCDASLPLAIAAIQHHLTAFNPKPTRISAARRNDHVAYMYQPMDRINTDASATWLRLNELAAYRRANARDMYAGFTYVDPGAHFVDGYRQEGEPGRDIASQMDGDEYAADPVSKEDLIVYLVRGMLARSTDQGVRPVSASKSDAQLAVMQRRIEEMRVAVHQKLHEVRDAHGCVDKQKVPGSIARALVERGLAVEHVKLLSVEVSAEEIDEFREKGLAVLGGGVAAQKVRAALRVVLASYDPDEDPPGCIDSPHVTQWYIQVIALAQTGRLLARALRSLSLLEQTRLWIEEWDKAGSFVDICVKVKRDASVGVDVPARMQFACPTCKHCIEDNDDTVIRFACGAHGCSACTRKHSAKCGDCTKIDDSLPAPVHFKLHPFARHQVEQEWARLLGVFKLGRRVRDHCAVQEWLSNLSGIPNRGKFKAKVGSGMAAPRTNWHSSAFTRMFGAKVQAIAMYILQQLEVDPSAKFVVLSEYLSQQHLLGLALDLLNIRAELVLHAASEYAPIRAFKTDPSVRVLIIPFTKCVPGKVDLTEATHVLLAHPFVGPSPELNAKLDDDDYIGPAVAMQDVMAQEARDLERWRAAEEQSLNCFAGGVAGRVAGRQADGAGQQVKAVRFVIQGSMEAELAVVSDKGSGP